MMICVDLGATNIKSCLVKDGKIISDIQVIKTNASKGREGIAYSFLLSVKNLLNDEVECVAVSSAGDIDKYSSTITYATDNLPGVIGLNFNDLVMETFNIPAYAINDGEAALLGELNHGAEDKLKDQKIVMLTFGTGIGAAIYDKGKLELKKYGHLSLVENGIGCTCGKKGCAEAYLSSKAIIKEIETHHLDKDNFFINYLNKEKEYVFYFDDYLVKLNELFKMIKKDFDFDVVIIGGGITDWMNDLFKDIYKKLPYKIVKANLNNAAGMLGAYDHACKMRNKNGQ